MYQELQRTCTAIVLFIKPFVSRRSRSRCRRGFLKLPFKSLSVTSTSFPVLSALDYNVIQFFRRLLENCNTLSLSLREKDISSMSSLSERWENSIAFAVVQPAYVSLQPQTLVLMVMAVNMSASKEAITNQRVPVMLITSWKEMGKLAEVL